MLTKLLKYDLQAQARLFFPFYICFVLITVINKIFYEITNNGTLDNALLNLVSTLFILFYTISFIAILILTYAFFVTHFYKTMTKDEAYLTMTLPVKTSQLIVSKTISAAIWQAATFLLITISIFIFSFGYDINSTIDSIKEFFLESLFNNNYDNMNSVMISTLIVMAIQLFSSPLKLFFAIAVGHLFKRHRIMGAIGIYFILYLVLKMINYYMSVFFLTSITDTGVFLNMSNLSSIAMELIVIVFCFFMSKIIFSKNLNLE